MNWADVGRYGRRLSDHEEQIAEERSRSSRQIKSMP